MTTSMRVFILSGLCLALMLAGWLTGHDVRHAALLACDAGCWAIFPRVKFPEGFSLDHLTNDSIGP